VCVCALFFQKVIMVFVVFKICMVSNTVWCERKLILNPAYRWPSPWELLMGWRGRYL